MDSLEVAKLASKAALDKKALKIIVMDLRGRSGMCDYQFICSAENDRQTKAICDSIEDTLRKEAGVKPFIIEGRTNGNWILMDYSGVTIHIFIDELRGYYALEQLWSNSQIVDLNN